MEAMGKIAGNSKKEIETITQSLNGLTRLSESFWHIQSSTDFWNAVRNTLDTLKSLISFNHAIVMIYNHDKHHFDWQRLGSIPQSTIKELQSKIFETLFYYVISDKRPLILDHTLKEIVAGHDPMTTGDGSCLAVPIIQHEQAIGLLILEHSKPHAFTDQNSHVALLYANHLGFSYYRLQNPITEESLAHRYHHLFERINVPLFYCATEGFLQCANQAFLDLMELRDIQDVFDINFFDRIQLVQQHPNSFHELVKKCGFLKNLEARIQCQDGQVITVLISIMPLRDENRQVTGYEGVVWDISEKRDLEAQLIQAQKLGALGSLTGGIAHDFNNLIGGIMGCASMLLSEIPDSHPFYGDVMTIMNASKRAADLTGQLLSFSRKHQYEIKDVSIHLLINEVLNILSRTLPKNIQIHTEIEPDLHPLHVDATQMEQALMNICINARDAMPSGGILTIEAESVFLDHRAMQITKNLQPGSYVLIRIRDTGCGMSKELQDHIFEPFFTTKSVNNGSGLGLAIVADIVEKHKGCISVQSEDGKGSMFEMLIPAGLSEQEKENLEDEGLNLPAGDETVLLVDDEDVIRRMGKRMLEKYGYQVILARNGEEAIKIFKDHHVDLVILDMIMPKLDGFRTLGRLQKIDSKVKALLFTGNITEEGQKRCKEAGFVDLVTKPFETGDFLQIVRDAIDQKK
ncbi:response regulator [bacterium]|nr:response regulator [bacterium]